MFTELFMAALAATALRLGLWLAARAVCKCR